MNTGGNDGTGGPDSGLAKPRSRPRDRQRPPNNAWCEIAGIDAPTLEEVTGHREANTYALLIVALLEYGEPMSLPAVAERFEVAGIAPAGRARLSLSRCRPARPPVYRDGDRYALDPHSDELRLWLFRLDLRPPRAPVLRLVRPDPQPVRGPGEPLTVDELKEAWSGRTLGSWSAQRLALAVLDAHRRPMAPTEVVVFVRECSRFCVLSENAAAGWHRGAAIRVRDDGRWEAVPEHEALTSARVAVREQLEKSRRWAAEQPDPAVLEASWQAAESRRAARGAELARLRRVIARTFPAAVPQAVVLADVAERRLETYLGPELEKARRRLAAYDVIGAVNVRATLKALGVEPGRRRLAELGPPQKTKKLNRRGRTLKITLPMLAVGSCGISRPLGDEKKLLAYLREGKMTRLRRRLEADAKSLVALYEYGRLHRGLRLRWGFLDEFIRVPWVSLDEPGLYGQMKEAYESGRAIEAVIGSAPGWAEPWSRARRCRVETEDGRYRYYLIDENGMPVDDRLIQLARLATPRE